MVKVWGQMASSGFQVDSFGVRIVGISLAGVGWGWVSSVAGKGKMVLKRQGQVTKKIKKASPRTNCIIVSFHSFRFLMKAL